MPSKINNLFQTLNSKIDSGDYTKNKSFRSSPYSLKKKCATRNDLFLKQHQILSSSYIVNDLSGVTTICYKDFSGNTCVSPTNIALTIKTPLYSNYWLNPTYYSVCRPNTNIHFLMPLK